MHVSSIIKRHADIYEERETGSPAEIEYDFTLSGNTTVLARISYKRIVVI